VTDLGYSRISFAHSVVLGIINSCMLCCVHGNSGWTDIGPCYWHL